MIKYYVFIFLTIILLAACGSETNDITPSATPNPSATPIPVLPETMDWHILFSSDQDVELFRCQVLEGIDGATRSLIEPVSVMLTGVLISPQMLDEASHIFEQINPTILSNIDSLRNENNLLVVMMRLDFIGDRQQYEPYQMLISIETAEATLVPALNTLNEIRFRYGNSSFSDQWLWLRINNETVLTGMDLQDLELEVGEIYPFVFELQNLNQDDLFSSNIELVANLELLVPFIIDTCEINHYGRFKLNFNMVDGDSVLLSELFGSLESREFDQNLINDFRIQFLANIMPRLPLILPTAMPTPSVTPTSTMTPSSTMTSSTQSSDSETMTPTGSP